jgi:acyl-CoA thioesterase-1
MCRSAKFLPRTATIAAIRIATIAAGVLVAGSVAASAQDAAPACRAPSMLMQLDETIVHTAAHLTEGRTLRIVAFGSSSTAGAGASSPAATYPSRLEAELRARFADMDIVVLNRGVGGEDAREMLARLDRDVIAEHPDLVLWQVGTNAIMDDEQLPRESSLIHAGLARLKAAGIDVVLVDPQYAPKVIGKPRAGAMVRLLETVARDEHVGVFHRFAIMAHWRISDGIPFDRFTSRDGLHMNDWSYDCVAKLLASAIVDASSRPVVAKVASHRARS